VIGELREAAADELAEVSVAKLKRSGVSGHDIAVGNRNAAAIKRQADAAKAANDPEFEKKHPRGRGQQGGQFVRKGSTDSEAVRDAQRRLGVKRDGVFGSQTLEAVKELQRKAGLTVDGVIGHATMRALLGKRTSKADEGALTAADRSALRRDKPRRRRSGVSTAPGAGYGRSREAEELVEESLLGELAEASIFSVARRGWSETLHPRGRGGRFADKPDVPKAAPSRNPARSGPRNTPKPKVSPLRPDAPRGPERPSSNEARKIGEKELPGMVGTGPWSKAVPELTAKLRAGSVEDSESFFRPGGRAYPPERVALHARIVNLMLQGAGAHQQPEALFLAGGPASGKSTLVNSGRARPKPDAVDVNPDIVRTMLPEYQALVAAGDEGASAKVHEEASHISKMVMNLALMRRHHVTVDGTGNGGPGAFSRKIEAARGAGLSVLDDRHGGGGVACEGSRGTVGPGRAGGLPAVGARGGVGALPERRVEAGRADRGLRQQREEAEADRAARRERASERREQAAVRVVRGEGGPAEGGAAQAPARERCGGARGAGSVRRCAPERCHLGGGAA
jgi:hypothetical protein